MFALALVNVDAEPPGPLPALPALALPTPAPPTPAPRRSTTTNPDGRSSAPDGAIASTLTSTRTKQPRDNVDSGQRRYKDRAHSPRTRPPRSREKVQCPAATRSSGQRL